MITLATTPQPNFKLLSRGFKLYAASFKQVYGLALLFSLIVFVPQMIAFNRGLGLTSLAKELTFYNVFFVLIDFMALFVFTAMLWRMRCVVTNQHESIFDDFKIASQKILLIIGASILYMFLIACVMFFFILLPAKSFISIQTMESLNIVAVFLILYFVVSVYIFYLFFFYLPLILTENKSIVAALFKSAKLVWGNWWRVFLLLITPPIIYFLTLLILQSVLQINLTIDVNSQFTLKAFFILFFNICFFALFVPLQGALLLLQLRDLEIRKQTHEQR